MAEGDELVQDYRNLVFWRKAHQITLDIYAETKGFPKAELFGITSQLRRASSSVSANLAEGCGRGSDPDFSRFVHHSLGSLMESDYFITLARDLGYVSQDQARRFHGQMGEVRRMLIRLLQTLKG